MSVVKNEVKEFKKEFLYYDKRQLENFKNQYPVRLEFLNEQIAAAGEVLKRPLSDKEKIQVKDQGTEWVKDLIRQQYQFPNSDDSFNLQALGVDYTALNDANLKISRIPYNYDYKLVNSVFTELETEYIKNKDQAKVYTTNDNQNKVLGHCKELEKTFTKMIEANLIPDYARQNISKVTKYMTVEYENNVLMIQPQYRILEDVK